MRFVILDVAWSSEPESGPSIQTVRVAEWCRGPRKRNYEKIILLQFIGLIYTNICNQFAVTSVQPSPNKMQCLIRIRIANANGDNVSGRNNVVPWHCGRPICLQIGKSWVQKRHLLIQKRSKVRTVQVKATGNNFKMCKKGPLWQHDKVPHWLLWTKQNIYFLPSGISNSGFEPVILWASKAGLNEKSWK